MSEIAEMTTDDRIEELVGHHLPEGASVLVACQGDELPELSGRTTLAFPESTSPDATPTGLAVIAHLEAQRALGAGFLLVPASGISLLDEDAVLDRHLRQRYAALVDDDRVAILFDLRRRPLETVWDQFRQALVRCEESLDHEPAVLDWGTGFRLQAEFPDVTIFSPLNGGSALPYLDESTDVVAISDAAPATVVEEARRVAKLAVMKLPSGANGRALEIDWKIRARAGAERTAVIVPCRGPWEIVEASLRSLKETLEGTEYEVVLAGDPAWRTLGFAADWLGEDRRVRFFEVAPGSSVSAVCNDAAATSGADIFVFLLPISCLLPDWLLALVRTLHARNDVGAVGGKVLSFYGELVHAGGHLFADGSPHTAGLGARPDAPLFSCTREIDYTSPAVIATRRAVFDAIGRFSTAQAASAFSVEYCLRLWDRGYRVYYQPDSAAVLLDRQSGPSLFRRALKGAWNGSVGVGRNRGP